MDEPERFFNTTGPCLPDMHYMLPAAQRLPEADRLIARQKYFVVHAPRQTGKTTTILALAKELTASGRYAALALSCQAAGAAGEDMDLAEERILAQIQMSAEDLLPPELRPPAWPAGPVRLHAGLRDWTRACPRPLVLFFDEIDALVGQSLISVLSQLRTGYNARPAPFPASVILCGMRDVKAGGVQATGQVLTDDGVDFAYELTKGQPWLVKALAAEVIDEMRVPPTEAIGPRRLDTARERLIRARATHLDSLAARLNEARVQRIIQPLITGEQPIDPEAESTFNDDRNYVRDLGLIAKDNPLRTANPIYAEVIPRVLGAKAQAAVTADSRDFITDEGTLDFDKLLRSFLGFWKANGEVLSARSTYHEAAPHLVLMAYLYKIVNRGGTVDREHAIGTGRSDLLVRWPYQNRSGKRVWQREALELKVWHPNRPKPAGGETTARTHKIGQAKSPSGRRITLVRA